MSLVCYVCVITTGLICFCQYNSTFLGSTLMDMLNNINVIHLHIPIIIRFLHKNFVKLRGCVQTSSSSSTVDLLTRVASLSVIIQSLLSYVQVVTCCKGIYSPILRLMFSYCFILTLYYKV